MFEAKLSRAGILKKVFDSIKDLLNDANVNLAEDGIRILQLDRAHVAFLSLFLGVDMFESYKYDRNRTLGVHLPSLGKILKCCDNDDNITLRMKDSKPDHLTIMIDRMKKDQEVVGVFEMKLMNLDIDTLEIPFTRYTCIVDMPANEFCRVINDLEKFGETIGISVSSSSSKGNKIQFSTSGDTGKAKLVLYGGNEDDDTSSPTKIHFSVFQGDDDEEGDHGSVNLTFSAKFLASFTKASTLTDRVKLNFATDLPLLVEYNLANDDGDKEKGYIRYYLAPKLEDN